MGPHPEIIIPTIPWPGPKLPLSQTVFELRNLTAFVSINKKLSWVASCPVVTKLAQSAAVSVLLDL